MDGTQGRQGEAAATENPQSASVKAQCDSRAEHTYEESRRSSVLSQPQAQITPLIPPNELEDLKSHEIPELADAGDAEAMNKIAERLIDGLVHCDNPQTRLNISDLTSFDYRTEVLLCALWTLSLARSCDPPKIPGGVEDVRPLMHEAPFSDAEANMVAIQWLLAPTTDRMDVDLYRYTTGRLISTMAYERVLSYTFKKGGTVPEAHAEQLVVILKNMSKNCAWKRTKDTHCFQQIKALLKAPRLATLVYSETPMEQITLQLDPEITNKVVASRTDFDAGKKITNAKWHRESSTEMFIAAVGVLREYLDVDLRLYINSEIPFSHADKLPAFVLLCEEYAEETGTLFGFIHDSVVYFLDPGTPFLIPQTICRWLSKSLQTCRSTTLDMLDEAIVDPERIMESNKFFKFVRGADAAKEGSLSAR